MNWSLNWFGCVFLQSYGQNSAGLDICSTEFKIWSAMASAAFKCVKVIIYVELFRLVLLSFYR